MIRTSTLTSDVVREIFTDCLYGPDDDPALAIIIQGVTVAAKFNQATLKRYRYGIKNLLAQLPTEFKRSFGFSYGDCFLNAGVDRTGTRWTTSEKDIEMLVQLGIAIDEASYQGRDPESRSMRFVVHQ